MRPIFINVIDFLSKLPLPFITITTLSITIIIIFSPCFEANFETIDIIGEGWQKKILS